MTVRRMITHEKEEDYTEYTIMVYKRHKATVILVPVSENICSVRAISVNLFHNNMQITA